MYINNILDLLLSCDLYWNLLLICLYRLSTNLARGIIGWNWIIRGVVKWMTFFDGQWWCIGKECVLRGALKCDKNISGSFVEVSNLKDVFVISIQLSFFTNEKHCDPSFMFSNWVWETLNSSQVSFYDGLNFPQQSNEHRFVRKSHTFVLAIFAVFIMGYYRLKVFSLSSLFIYSNTSCLKTRSYSMCFQYCFVSVPLWKGKKI